MTFFDPNQPPFTQMDYGNNIPTNVDMAGSYQESKPGLGKIYKEGAVATGGFVDEQPLITPDKLKQLFLFGIPLLSAIRNPITNRPDIMTDPILKEYIVEAAALAEAESKIEILPTQFVESQAFDRVAYDAFGYFQLRRRPIASLEAITVTPSNETPMLRLPLDWCSTTLLHLGQVNLIPLTLATRGNAIVPLATAPFGATWLNLLAGGRSWVPSMWEFTYTAGFPEGAIPRIVNQYIGCIAAMEILSALAATYAKSTSTSLGIDGLSQSISLPGAQIFTQRLEELAAKRKWLKSRIQASVNMNFVVDNV
jgi:hypothetical protein